MTTFPRTGPAQADSITDRESTREAHGRMGVGSSFTDWPADDPPVKAAPGEPACHICGVAMSTNLRDGEPCLYCPMHGGPE